METVFLDASSMYDSNFVLCMGCHIVCCPSRQQTPAAWPLLPPSVVRPHMPSRWLAASSGAESGWRQSLRTAVGSEQLQRHWSSQMFILWSAWLRRLTDCSVACHADTAVSAMCTRVLHDTQSWSRSSTLFWSAPCTPRGCQTACGSYAALPTSKALPSVELEYIPPSLFRPYAPMSTTVKQYWWSISAIRTMEKVPL